MLTRNLADGEMSAEDRDYLVALVAERTGQTPEEAGAAVDTAVAEARAFYAEALDAAEQARVAGGDRRLRHRGDADGERGRRLPGRGVGGDHRDRNVPFGTFGRR